MAKTDPEVTEFVRWLVETSGAPSRRQFAIRAGVLETSLASWVSGEGMNAANLVKLMRAAGLLDVIGFSGGQAARAAAGRHGEPVAPDAGHQGQLAEAAELVREVRLLLPELRALIAAPPAGAAAPPRGRASG